LVVGAFEEPSGLESWASRLPEQEVDQLKIDIEGLRVSLLSDQAQQLLTRFHMMAVASRAENSSSQTRAQSWRELQIFSDVAHLLHSTTISRLDADQYDERPIEAATVFESLHKSGANIRETLPVLRRLVTPYGERYRTGPVAAEAGYTTLVVIFPASKHIQSTLTALEEFRRAAPLGHPVWNALFLEAMLLQLHPFRDGNGRTIRAFTDYEFWRSNLGTSDIKNIRRAVDANRATQLKLLIQIQKAPTAAMPPTKQIFEYLIFLLKLRIIALGEKNIRLEANEVQPFRQP